MRYRTTDGGIAAVDEHFIYTAFARLPRAAHAALLVFPIPTPSLDVIRCVDALCRQWGATYDPRTAGIYIGSKRLMLYTVLGIERWAATYVRHYTRYQCTGTSTNQER